MDKKTLVELIDKVNSGTGSDDDLSFYNAYLNQVTHTDESWSQDLVGRKESIEAELLYRIDVSIGRKGKQIRLWQQIAAAASILLFLAIGGYFLFRKSNSQQMAQNESHDIPPGGNRAILTLANGKVISLTDSKNGNIAQQSGTQITKTKNGQVVYYANAATNATVSGSKVTEVVYNTISTPRGGQYAIALSDGTLAYLDAASSIKYPVNFNGKERQVEITGQVYFEVKHDPKKTFRVLTKGEVIEDIGTHFNVNAYDDEPNVKTTLLEGKIRVATNTHSSILNPGQQSVVSLPNNYFKVLAIDAAATIAWKEGHFHFDKDNLQTVMRQLSRWYSVEVKYIGPPTHSTFSGDIDRNSNAAVVLKILSLSGAKFRIEGQEIIVSQ